MSENYNEIIAALLERVSVLERELAETRKLLAEKDAVIAAQSTRIKELEERSGKNPQNSSKPPSSDGYRKPRPVTGKDGTESRSAAGTSGTRIEHARKWRHLLSATKLTWKSR